jgi:hypothetical protein
MLARLRAWLVRGLLGQTTVNAYFTISCPAGDPSRVAREVVRRIQETRARADAEARRPPS